MTRPIGDANNPVGRQQYAALAIFLDTDVGLTGLSLAGGCSQPVGPAPVCILSPKTSRKRWGRSSNRLLLPPSSISFLTTRNT